MDFLNFKGYSMKPHKYDTLNSLKLLTPAQIVTINPKDIGSNIKNRNPDSTKLNPEQEIALDRLLDIKASPTLRINILQFFINNHGDDTGIVSAKISELIQDMDQSLQKKESKIATIESKQGIEFAKQEAELKKQALDADILQRQYALPQRQYALPQQQYAVPSQRQQYLQQEQDAINFDEDEDEDVNELIDKTKDLVSDELKKQIEDAEKTSHLNTQSLEARLEALRKGGKSRNHKKSRKYKKGKSRKHKKGKSRKHKKSKKSKKRKTRK